ESTCDDNLGADAVRGGGKQRPLVRGEGRGVVKARKGADAAKHLGAVGTRDGRFHQLNGAVPRRRVHPCRGIRDALVRHAEITACWLSKSCRASSGGSIG